MINFKTRSSANLVRSIPTLEITTVIGCPLACTFCPQNSLSRSYKSPEKVLTISNFRKILSTVPKHVQIDFSGMSEPWANKSCTDMLEYSLVNGYSVAIYTTLDGLLPPDVTRVKALLELYNSQIKALVIHLPDANGNMRGWKPSDDWFFAFKQFSSLNIDCGVLSMCMDSNSRIHPDVKLFVDSCLPFIGNSRAGSLDTNQIGQQEILQIPKHTRPILCSATEYYDNNVVLPNGDVVICCMDYSLQHNIGNLLIDSYYDLYQSSEFRRLLVANNEPKYSSDSICKSCTRAIPMTPLALAREYFYTSIPDALKPAAIQFYRSTIKKFGN